MPRAGIRSQHLDIKQEWIWTLFHQLLSILQMEASLDQFRRAALPSKERNQEVLLAALCRRDQMVIAESKLEKMESWKWVTRNSQGKLRCTNSFKRQMKARGFSLRHPYSSSRDKNNQDFNLIMVSASSIHTLKLMLARCRSLPKNWGKSNHKPRSSISISAVTLKWAQISNQHQTISSTSEQTFNNQDLVK